MTLELHPHPETPAGAVTSIRATADRVAADSLELVFILRGNLEEIRIPEPAPIARSDRLWQHTCFEAFIRADDEAGYCEINLSPSRAWAAYAFDGYRSGMADALSEPETAFLFGKREVVLTATLSGLPANQVWQIGLSAVIEDRDGARSYWALRHPPGKPDFHHEDCFALRLPPAA